MSYTGLTVVSQWFSGQSSPKVPPSRAHGPAGGAAIGVRSPRSWRRSRRLWAFGGIHVRGGRVRRARSDEDGSSGAPQDAAKAVIVKPSKPANPREYGPT